MYSKPWLFNGEPVLAPPVGAMAFVYKLTRLSDGKAYIGKKLFWSTRTKKVTSKKTGKVSNKRVVTESDWRDYWSSSKEIQLLVESGEHFSREILHFCVSKGVVNYMEAREQMDHRVLEHPDLFFNGQIQVRVHHSHIKSLQH